MPPTVRLIAIAVSLAAYLGLAVLGAGGFAAFFSKPALIGLTAVLAALGLASFFAGGNLSPGEREDRSNRWVIPVFGLVGLALAYLPAYTDRIDFWIIDGDATRWTGVALFAVGGALRLWPVFVLGDRFSGLGGDPARPSARHHRHLQHHPPPELSGAFHQLARLGTGIQIRRWRFDSRASHRADHRANKRRGGVAANAVWRRIRRLSRPHKPPHARRLLETIIPIRLLYATSSRLPSETS